MRLIPILIFTISTFSCDHPDIVKGRKAYKRYLNEVLSDPKSLTVYKEDVDRSLGSITFQTEIGSKNLYGGMTRNKYTFTVKDGLLIKINGRYYKDPLSFTGERMSVTDITKDIASYIGEIRRIGEKPSFTVVDGFNVLYIDCSYLSGESRATVSNLIKQKIIKIAKSDPISKYDDGTYSYYWEIQNIEILQMKVDDVTKERIEIYIGMKDYSN